MEKFNVELSRYEIGMIISLLERESVKDKERRRQCMLAGDEMGVDLLSRDILNTHKLVVRLIEVTQNEENA